MNAIKALRILMTLAICVIAVMVGTALWDHYMLSPWTRDGRVRADVVAIAPDVAGLIADIPVHDNEYVHKGDLLMRIDDKRYQMAVDQAEAALKAADVERHLRKQEAARRAKLDSLVISKENRETTSSQAAAADAKYDAAQAALDVAKLNLERTEIHAPVDGYVTNFTAQVGDYASVGKPVLALINAHSYYILGYFEETKLPRVRAGDPVRIHMMDGEELTGRVQSVPRGITDQNDTVGRSMLANVNPTYNWVRLAQRIPVRISIDDLEHHPLIAGQTCTVVIKPGKQDTKQAAAAPAG
ncbi:efflux RND transporter periplasmic adaptor subunit [Solimonas marina]|uniref:Efflux RND transporter periplasmic adaptor subunit n=1 Tax=Solimonas marina TaxID=2714601 RepID=A0A969W914_9GAMM|nr:efflux RND transporter periplasmic adaptor subunit [Solimonas marina]NKF22862.1 efflux RND transporter periplasmic adaptor subunit [Solimonas marina]